MSSSDGSGGCRIRLEVAVGDFERFLVVGKGVSVATRECYVRYVLRFFTEVVDAEGVVDFADVSASWVRSM